MEQMPCVATDRHAVARRRLQTFTRRVDALIDRRDALVDRTCALLHNGGIHPHAPEVQHMEVVLARIGCLSLRLQSHFEHLIDALRVHRFDTEACALVASVREQIGRLPARRSPADVAEIHRKDRCTVTPPRPAART